MADTDPTYFSARYAADPDPWGFDRHWYERRKFALTVAALPRSRCRRGLEPGCANGALTELLADRCDELVAFDFIASTVARASVRLQHQQHVQVLEARFPDFWPLGSGDLVVWSEIAYYLSGSSADRAMMGLERWLEPGGTLIAVHYTGETDYPRRGSEIARWIDRMPFLERMTTLLDESFELGVWRRIHADRGTRV